MDNLQAYALGHDAGYNGTPVDFTDISDDVLAAYRNGYEDGTDHWLADGMPDEPEPEDDREDDDGLTDAEADSMTLAGAGWGTDEDYGYYGEDNFDMY